MFAVGLLRFGLAPPRTMSPRSWRSVATSRCPGPRSLAHRPRTSCGGECSVRRGCPSSSQDGCHSSSRSINGRPGCLSDVPSPRGGRSTPANRIGRYGTPPLLIRDLSPTIREAVIEVFPNVPQQEDHWHYLSVLGPLGLLDYVPLRHGPDFSVVWGAGATESPFLSRRLHLGSTGNL